MSARIPGVSAHTHLAIVAAGYTVKQLPKHCDEDIVDHWHVYFQQAGKTYRFWFGITVKGQFVNEFQLRPRLVSVTNPERDRQSMGKAAEAKVDAFFPHLGLYVYRGGAAWLRPIGETFPFGRFNYLIAEVAA